MKRIFALILIFLMLCPFIVACGDGGKEAGIDHVLRHYGISLDELVYGNEVDIMAFRFKPTLPDYAARSIWDEYSKNLLIEYVQSYEEGKDIGYLKNLIEEINSLKDSKEKHDMADIVYNLISEAPLRKDYKYLEPSTAFHSPVIFFSCKLKFPNTL